MLFLCSNAYAAMDQEKKGEKEAPVGVPLNQALDPRFVLIRDIIIPIIYKGKIETYYMVECVIEAVDADAAVKVRQAKPLLVNALVTDFYHIMNIIWYPELRIDIEALHHRFVIVAQNTLGKALIKDVLIQNLHKQIS